MGAHTPPVTDASFVSDVLQADGPVLVDFWAEWCGPCKAIAPVLDEIAGEHGAKLKIVKLNVDENPVTARNYQVMSIPTMAVFEKGQIVKQIIGARPKGAILKELQDYIS
jgi:thioredoxin 1